MGGMGAGDVKLCAAIGAWIGPGQLFWSVFFTAMAGGVMVFCWAVLGGFVKDVFADTGNLVFGGKEHGTGGDAEVAHSTPPKRKMPYAPAIAVGTLVSFFAH
jgi:prepilin peptidase CpaA